MALIQTAQLKQRTQAVSPATEDTFGWRPVLAGELQRCASDAVAGVAAEVQTMDRAGVSPALLCESGLFFAYLAQAEPDKGWSDTAINYLETASDRMASLRQSNLGLYGGLAGIGWVHTHLSALLATETDTEDSTDAEDSLEDVDQILLQVLAAKDWGRPYDLVSGLVGIGVYFLERLPVDTAYRGLDLVLSHLERLSEESWGGITWHTRPEVLTEEQRKISPAGYYNLGVAHGVPGIVPFLAEVVVAGVGNQRAQRLLEGAVQWIIAQQRPPAARTRYGFWFVPGMGMSDSRLGWCYGDLGVAAVLHHTAMRVGREDWLQFARSLLDRCMSWDPERNGVYDALLCHGALGVAHIFNRVSQTDGEPRYRDAAHDWYERGLAMRRPGTPVAGFPAWHSDDPLVADYSFLAGAIGAGLALLAATSDIEPEWDRLLLLSGCPRR